MSFRIHLMVSLCALGACLPLSPLLAAAPAIQTLYIAPSGTGGSGSASSPFALTAGREYEFNRLVRPFLDAGVPVKAVFLDGTYSNVRLQIIRQGVDTATIYLLEPSQDGQAPSSYHPGAQCDTEGQNCEVVAADFTMGANTNTPLALVAEHPGQAVFDGSLTRDLRPAIDSEALAIAGAIVGGPASDPYDVKSSRINNVLVQGLSFVNYRNGIHLRYATDIFVQACLVTNIGNRIPRTADADPYGSFAVGIDSAVQRVRFFNNMVTDAWNVGSNGTYAAGAADPGLMHSVYIGDSRDTVFKDNTLTGSSGPMIKWGFYPQVSGSTVYEYPAAPAWRRNFFIGNTLILDVAHDGPQAIAAGSLGEAFIHDNSREIAGSQESAPAAGIVFLSNRFDNKLPLVDGLPVALLRQEVALASDVPSYPAWSFQGNVISGVAPSQLLITRRRDTSLVASSFSSGDVEQALAYQLNLPSQTAAGLSPATDDITILAALLTSTLRSDDPVEDAAVLALAQ